MSPATFSRELEVAKRLARQAAQVIMDHYRAGVEVKYKDRAESDPVTAADRDANAIIVEAVESFLGRNPTGGVGNMSTLSLQITP